MPGRTAWITVLLIVQVVLSWVATLAHLAARARAVAAASSALMLVSVALTLLQSHDSRKAQRLTVRRIMNRRLEGLVGHLRAAAPQEHVRANVMLVDARAQLLKVFAHIDLSPAEVQLVWAKGQGICGVAWAEGRGQIAPGVTTEEFEAQRARNHSTPWNITEQQCRATQGLGTVASLPLRSTRDEDRIIGLLNFDSIAEPATSLLAEVLSSTLYRALDLEDLLTSIV